ncbi:MAG: hypothetical protein AAF138_00015 [Planctomycetota bacterium]
MAATMNKSDVKYEEKNIKNVDWNQVRTLMGKSVPTVAMQSVKGFAKSNPKAYVKVGLIKKDLYLRVKDGSKHLDDIKLAANWTAPAGAGGAVDESDPAVKGVVRQVKGMLAQMKAGEKTIKAKHKVAEGLADEAKDRVEAAAKGAGGYEDTEIKGIKRLQATIARAQTEAQKAYDDEVFKPFSDMRTSGFLPWPTGTDPKVKKAWGSDFYQSSMKPVYARSKDILDEISTFIDEIDDALDTAQTGQRDGAKAATTVDKKVAALLKKMNAEWNEASDRVFLSDGRGPGRFNDALDGIRDFMNNKYEAVKGGTMDLEGQLQQLGNIGSKLTMLDKSMKGIERRGKAIETCAN